MTTLSKKCQYALRTVLELTRRRNSDRPTSVNEIAAAIDLIVHIGRLEDGSRKVLSVVEVQDLKGDNIVLEELFTWEKTGVGEDDRFTGVFKATGATPSFTPTLAAMGLTFPEGMFEAQN